MSDSKLKEPVLTTENITQSNVGNKPIKTDKLSLNDGKCLIIEKFPNGYYRVEECEDNNLNFLKKKNISIV